MQRFSTDKYICSERVKPVLIDRVQVCTAQRNHLFTATSQLAMDLSYGPDILRRTFKRMTLLLF